jgi:HD-GYP domain-containing protein (c-di-GMP phosphodiesterase class II)
MAKMKDLSDLRKSIESTPLMVTLEYLYTKNISSPVATNKTSEQKYTELAAIVSDMLYNKLRGESAENARDIPLTSLFSISEMIILSLTKSKEILLTVMNPRYAGDFLAYHSLNVAFLSCAVGMGMEFQYRELTEIGVSALLHDIGMTKIDSDCYLSKEALSKSQRDEMEKHPILGWQFFEKLKSDFPWLLRVICEEHKREHGQGYPSNVDGDLHPYSRVVGLCDSFEALTHNRIYRKAFHPADAMKAIVAAKESVFARDILRGMIESLGMFPVGSIVQLNNKNAALVVEAVWRSPLRPIVRLIRENHPEPAETIDLSKENNLYITGIIYNDDYQIPKDLRVT